MSKFFLILTISIAAFFIWSGRALAQGPTCVGVDELDDYFFQYQVQTSSNFPTLPLDITPFWRSDKNVWRQSSWIKTTNPLTTATEIRWTIDADDNGSCPNCDTNLYYGNNQSSFGLLHHFPDTGSTGVITTAIESPTGHFNFYLEMQAVTEPPRLTLEQLELCFSELPEPPEPPLECPLVPNFNFESSSNWTLFQSASISDGLLSLSDPGIAYQNLNGLQSNTAYSVVISVTNVYSTTSDLPDLFVQLQNDLAQATDVEPGLLNVDLKTDNVSGPILFSIESSGAGTVEIDYVCLSLASTGPDGEQNACIAPANGEFTNAANWDFYRGAAWLPDTKNASLPAANSGLARDAGDYELPSLAGGEYLLLSFEAVATSGDNGLIGANVNNGVLDFTGFFETYQTLYTFEADVSSLAGESFFDIAFASVPTDTLTADIELDNVCIFVSDRLPNLPQPTDPGGWTPVDLDSGWYNCSDVETYVFANFGIDLRYHQVNYAMTPGAWDFSDWVPWLISWGWVTFETAVCLTLVLFHTLVNLLEYILNNGLNIFAWGRANATNFIPWAYDWLINFDLSWDNLGNWLSGTAENWLTWAGLAVIEFALAYGSIFANLATLALWFGAGFVWLGGLLLPLLAWLLADGNNVLRFILNTLIDDGWNDFLTSLGNVLSTLIDLLITTIWNGGLLAFLQAVLPGVLSGPLSFINLVPLLWSLVWSVVMYLWVNVFQMINIPFAFYTGLSDGIQSTAFSDLASCNGSTQDFFCGVFAALDLVNGVAGHSIFYPIVIVGVIIGTIAILYRNFIALWNFYADWLTRL